MQSSVVSVVPPHPTDLKPFSPVLTVLLTVHHSLKMSEGHRFVIPKMLKKNRIVPLSNHVQRTDMVTFVWTSEALRIHVMGEVEARIQCFAAVKGASN